MKIPIQLNKLGLWRLFIYDPRRGVLQYAPTSISWLNLKILYITCISVFLHLFSMHTPGFAQGNIADYFLKNPKAWDETKKIIHKTPTKVIVTDGLEGLGFNLTELTQGDEVSLIFIETQKAEKLKRIGFCNAEDKLLPGKNRVVSVITRNSGDRTQFQYEFILQRNINNVPVTIYSNGNAVLESKYDGRLPLEDSSNLPGIGLCEIEIR